MNTSIPISVAGIVLGATSCTADPQYVQPAQAIEAGAADADPNLARAQITLPVRLESDDERMEREALEMQLGAMVPLVTLPGYNLSLEWTLRNLSDQDGTARIHLNGANEYFAYVPANFVVDPEDEEEPPPLAGNIPLEVPAQQTISGVFREDRLVEAAIDLELITRGALNPFTALLDHHEETQELMDESGVVIPREAFAHLVRLDLTLVASEHMVLEYALRVRDHHKPRLLHPEGLAAPPEDLTVFEPVDFQPPPPMSM